MRDEFNMIPSGAHQVFSLNTRLTIQLAANYLFDKSLWLGVLSFFIVVAVVTRNFNRSKNSYREYCANSSISFLTTWALVNSFDWNLDYTFFEYFHRKTATNLNTLCIPWNDLDFSCLRLRAFLRIQKPVEWTWRL